MEQEKNGLVPSTAVWEIAIKIKNHKLDLGVDIDDYIATRKGQAYAARVSQGGSFPPPLASLTTPSHKQPLHSLTAPQVLVNVAP